MQKKFQNPLMIDMIFLIATLIIAVYFIYKVMAKEKNKGLNGFSAGAFLVIFIYKAAPIFAGYFKRFFMLDKVRVTRNAEKIPRFTCTSNF